jgi:hypothetical protein
MPHHKNQDGGPMKFGGKVIAVVAVMGLMVTPLSPLNNASANSQQDDGRPAQENIDVKADATTYAGQWGDVTGGVAGRPYVKYLAVTPYNVSTKTYGSKIEYVTNGSVSTPTPTQTGAITMTLTPYNVCGGKTTTDCYSAPNRIGAMIGYVKGPNQLGADFSNPSVASVKDVMQEGSLVEVVINMNTWGSTLRWTWLNGIPTYWKVDNLGQANAEVSMKFALTTGPSHLCDTRIPAAGCDPSKAGAGFAPTEMLKTDFIFSLDDTGVDATFNGTLFASRNADLGSLEAVPVGSPTLGLTYGVTGSNELSGKENVGTFYAFVSDNSLLNYFGVTQDVLNSPDFRSSSTLAVTRADKGGQGEPVWERMTADTFGSSGYLLTVLDVRFNGSAVTQALRATQPALFKVGNKNSSSVSLRKSGSTYSVTASAKTKACKKSACRWVISKSTSTYSAKAKKLKTVAAKVSGTTVSGSASVKAKKNDRIAVVLQKQQKAKGKKATWVYVTSRLVLAS